MAVAPSIVIDDYQFRLQGKYINDQGRKHILFSSSPSTEQNPLQNFQGFAAYKSLSEGFWRFLYFDKNSEKFDHKEVYYKCENEYITCTFLHFSLQIFIEQNFDTLREFDKDQFFIGLKRFASPVIKESLDNRMYQKDDAFLLFSLVKYKTLLFELPLQRKRALQSILDFFKRAEKREKLNNSNEKLNNSNEKLNYSNIAPMMYIEHKIFLPDYTENQILYLNYIKELEQISYNKYINQLQLEKEELEKKNSDENRNKLFKINSLLDSKSRYEDLENKILRTYSVISEFFETLFEVDTSIQQFVGKMNLELIDRKRNNSPILVSFPFYIYHTQIKNKCEGHMYDLYYACYTYNNKNYKIICNIIPVGEKILPNGLYTQFVSANPYIYKMFEYEEQCSYIGCKIGQQYNFIGDYQTNVFPLTELAFQTPSNVLTNHGGSTRKKKKSSKRKTRKF